MENFSDDWNTTGGTNMGSSLGELLSSRPMNMAKEMLEGYKNTKGVDLIPQGGENFMKKGDREYEWSADVNPTIQNASGEYFNEGESSSFKKINYGNPQIEMKKTVTQIFK